MTKTLSKKYLTHGIWILFVLLFSQSEPRAQILPDNLITAKAAFLMDADSGSVLYEKNPDLPLPPASTTKVMTAIVALEQTSPDAVLRVNEGANRVPRSKIGVRTGEKWQLRGLLFSLLLNSANDASLVIAEGIAGSVEQFTHLMNLKAREAGAYNTHFVNPHGLDQWNHYATARDMTLILKYAIGNPILRQILETKFISIRGPGSRLIHLRNHNRLLGKFKGMVGGKTGYTSNAKQCFVGIAKRNGRDLLVCVFGSKNQFRDSARLLEYGFNGNMVEEGSNNLRVRKPANETPYNLKDRKSGYVLQVASFSEKRRATDLRQTLKEKGFHPFIEEATLENGDTFHRVKVGLYPNLKIAIKTKQRIKKHFGIYSSIFLQSG